MPPQQQGYDPVEAAHMASSDDADLLLHDDSHNRRQRCSRSRPFSQMISNGNAPRIRPSVVRRESFIVQFAKTKGPPQITGIMMLIAIGLGSCIGVIPAVMSDRFARLNHGYMGEESCSSFTAQNKPDACFAGSADAQSAVASANLISNVLTFVTSSLIGSLSDEYGRKGVLILGLFMGLLSPLMLVLIQLYPQMSPWWYYGCHASTGLVNWVAIALSSLADVLPQRFRAPGIGLLLAGFMLGFSLSPILAFLLSNLHLSMMSLATVALGLIATITCVPETLPPAVAAATRTRRQLERIQEVADDEEEAQEHQPQMWYIYARQVARFVYRPVREMSILNRDSFFRLISLLAFFSGMVSSGDQVLLVYYLEERLDFTAQDISVMFLIIGVMGLFAQGVLLKPLNDCLGEKLVVAVCFAIGAIDNTMYGLARNKATIYAAVALSALTGMAFPTISAIKANNVAVTEQGRIQGALYSLQALASGVGPVLLRFVYQVAKSTAAGPGAMFIFAGFLYWIAVAVACALPPERANAHSSAEAEDDINVDMDFDALESDSSEGPAESYGSMQ